MKYFLVICSIFIQQLLSAQQFGARNAALGIEGVANTSLFSSVANPAQLSFVDSSSIGININQLNLNTPARDTRLQSVIQKNTISLGIGLGNFGNTFYNLSNFELGLSKQLNPNQSIGISFNALREFIYLNDDALALQAKLGYVFKVNENWKIGGSLHQTFYSSNDRLRENNTFLGNRGLLGVYFQASDELALHGETIVDDRNSFRVGGGVNYNIKVIALQLGFSSAQSLLNAGVNIPIKKFNWQLTYGFHNRLGNSLQTQLLYKW